MIFDTLKNVDNYEGLGRVYTALKFLSETDFSKIDLGRYELDGDNIFYMVQSYETIPDKTVSECHEKYIDIQCMLEGREIVGIAPFECDKRLVEEKKENDVWFYDCLVQPLELFAGSFMVLYPNDLHCPAVAAEGKAETCRKVVFKVKV